MNDIPYTDDELAGRRDDLGRDLEVLLERLAESREAIVRLLAARSGGEEAVTEEAWRDQETQEAWGVDETEYVEPEASSPPVSAAEPLEPKLDSDVTPNQLPSSLRRPGPPALEVALIYRHIAENGGELLDEPPPGALSEESADSAGAAGASLNVPHTLTIAGSNPRAVARVVKVPGRGSEAANGPRAARRRLLAVVLVAVGSVVLLTTIVSLLPTLVNSL
jgi:hypothetical protein